VICSGNTKRRVSILNNGVDQHHVTYSVSLHSIMEDMKPLSPTSYVTDPLGFQPSTKMEYRLFVVAAVASLFVCQYLARTLKARWSFRRAMRKHGCKPILKYPHTDRVLGTDLTEKMNKARKDGDLMKRWPEIYKAAGGKTFEANIVGKKTLMTMDSKNIQAITATQIEKFKVEPVRGGFVNGWFGKGVFFSDDPHWSIGRKTIKPIFLRSQIGDLSGFGKHVSRMIELIPRDGSTIDLQDLVLDMVSTEHLAQPSRRCQNVNISC
jgi:hypothetical protein